MERDSYVVAVSVPGVLQFFRQGSCPWLTDAGPSFERGKGDQ